MQNGPKSFTLGKICLFAFLQRVKLEDWYDSHVGMSEVTSCSGNQLRLQAVNGPSQEIIIPENNVLISEI